MTKRILSILIVGLMLVPMMTFGISAHKTDVNEVAKTMGDKVPALTRMALSFKWDGTGLPKRYPGVFNILGDTEMFVENGVVDLPLLDKYEVTFPCIWMGKGHVYGIEYMVRFKNPEEAEQFKKELAVFNQMNIMDRSRMYSDRYTNEAFQNEYVKLVNEYRESKGLNPLNAKITMGNTAIKSIDAFAKGETEPQYQYGIGKYRGYAKQTFERKDILDNFFNREEQSAKLMAQLVFSELQEKGGLKSWDDERFSSTWLEIKKVGDKVLFFEVFDDTVPVKLNVQ